MLASKALADRAKSAIVQREIGSQRSRTGRRRSLISVRQLLDRRLHRDRLLASCPDARSPRRSCVMAMRLAAGSRVALRAVVGRLRRLLLGGCRRRAAADRGCAARARSRACPASESPARVRRASSRSAAAALTKHLMLRVNLGAAIASSFWSMLTRPDIHVASQALGSILNAVSKRCTAIGSSFRA